MTKPSLENTHTSVSLAGSFASEARIKPLIKPDYGAIARKLKKPELDGPKDKRVKRRHKRKPKEWT